MGAKIVGLATLRSVITRWQFCAIKASMAFALALSGTVINAPAQAESKIVESVYSSRDKLHSHDDFQAAIGLVTKRMATSYAKKEKSPLTIDVLDLDTPGMAQFVNGIMFADAAGYKMHSLMNLTYENQAKVNGAAASACLLMYNNKQRYETLVSYESYFKNKADILYYLAAHEFGHCMAMHQAGLGNIKALDERAQELFADKVAIAFFLANGNPQASLRIVDFNRERISPSSPHYHPQELSDFEKMARVMLLGAPAQKLTMYDLYQIASK